MAAISELGSDIVVLQEAWYPDGEPGYARLAAEAGGYRLVEHSLTSGVAVPGRRPRLVAGAGRGTGTWGLALMSRLPVTAVRRLRLGQLAMDGSPRAAIWVDVEVEGKRISVLGTHLSHLSHGSLIQLNRLRAFMPANCAAVLMGDMNMWGPVVSAMLPGYRRSVVGRTWPAWRPHSQIDHVLVTRQVDVVGSRVEPPLGSDHRPVTAVLNF